MRRREAFENLVANAARMGQRLLTALQGLQEEFACIGDVRGLGLMCAVEFVADRETKAPLDPARATAARIKSLAMEEGLVVYPQGGTIDGRAGDHVLIAPPFIISTDQIGELTDKLGRAVDRGLSLSGWMSSPAPRRSTTI